MTKNLNNYHKSPENDDHHLHEFYDAMEELSPRPSNLSGDNDSPTLPSSGKKSTSDDEDFWDSYAEAKLSQLWSFDLTSPLTKSPWSSYTELPEPTFVDHYGNYTGLMTSLVREEGHVYSLAASGDMLYTGSDSKNIRVWKNQKEFSGFKSHSGLVKSIVISGQKIFTGHQDGKIRVWKTSINDPRVHQKIGTLPTFKSVVKKSIRRRNYTGLGKNHASIWIKHLDAISSLCLNEDHSILYSSSWDKTIKVWRVSDFKCLESIPAHDDAVNAVVAGFDGFLFFGSADGTVKAWRREVQGKRTKHYFSHTLLKQDSTATSFAVNTVGTVVYGGCSDGSFHFWERAKHLCHGGVLRGHNMAVLCFAAAGNMVFSGSADGNICVWRRGEGGEHKCMYVLTGHTGPVKCLAVKEERRHVESRCDGGGDTQCIVYSGSLDKSVKIWRVCQQMPEMESRPVLQSPASQWVDGLRRSRAETQGYSSHRSVSRRRT